MSIIPYFSYAQYTEHHMIYLIINVDDPVYQLLNMFAIFNTFVIFNICNEMDSSARLKKYSPRHTYQLFNPCNLVHEII